MKNLQNTLKLAMIALILVFASCSKDDSPAEDNVQMEEPTIQEQLMTGKWYIQSTSGGGISDECERQTYLHFIDEDSLVIQSFGLNGTNCESDPVQIYEYQMTEADTFVLAELPASHFVVEFITESELILRQTDGVDSQILNLQK